MKQFGTPILLPLLLLASSAVQANPLSAPRDNNNNAPAKPPYITSCEAAHNCEIYTDANGKLKPRFKAGMEPGTAAYDAHQEAAAAKTKRDGGGASTQVTISDSSIYWGCDIDPVATLNNLSSICQTSGACLQGSPYTLGVNYLDPSAGGGVAPTQETLTISAEGSYPAWLRNGMIDAFQATMKASGVINSSTAHWGGGPAVPGHDDGTLPTSSCQIAQAPSEIVITWFSAPNTMEANVDVTVSLVADQGGLCGGSLGDAESLISAVSGAFGSFGAGIGAIFGTISASCTVMSGSS